MQKVISFFKKYLPGIVCFSSIVVVLGGLNYYLKVDTNALFSAKLMASLQNCLETIMFNPVISYADYIGQFSSSNFFSRIFGIVLVLIPLIDLLIVFSVFDFFISRILDRVSFNKKNVLVIGNNPEIERMLDHTVKGARIYRFVDGVLPNEVKKDYTQRGIIVKDSELNFGENDADDTQKLNEFNKFFKKNREYYVLLLDESDIHNVQLYMTLSKCEYCKNRTVHFYALINDFEMKCFLQDYFDGRLENEFGKKQKEPTKDRLKVENYRITHMDLSLFNLQQLNAEKTLEKMPLYTHVNEDKAIHMLIIGGGYAGRELLLHAMNQGVLTSSNSILIDVIDSDITIVENELSKRFNTNYVVFDKAAHTFEIPKEHSDGSFKIRLTGCDVTDDGFADEVMKLQKEENGGRLTYLALCVKDPNTNLHIMRALNSSPEFLDANYNIPVVARMSNVRQMLDYFRQFSFCSDALLIGENDEYIGIDEIINDEREKKMREYNETYDRIIEKTVWNGSLNVNPDDLFNTKYLFMRASNRALYNHRMIKDFIPVDDEISAFLNEAKNISGDKELSDLLISKNGDSYRFPKLLEYAMTEHRRFNYFFASQGWGFIDEDKKQPAKMLHNCLCTWEELAKERKVFDEKGETVKEENGKDKYDHSRDSKLIYDLISIPEIMSGKEE